MVRFETDRACEVGEEKTLWLLGCSFLGRESSCGVGRGDGCCFRTAWGMAKRTHWVCSQP